MRIVSPAKINLHLRVGPLGTDGFHPILSWMCVVGLHDVMEMRERDEPGIASNAIGQMCRRMRRT